ncbi:MAG: tRNA 2-selenouridine(34) synthase MnmH [Oscillatoriales cyanobacterium SM2_3_0]|nr:tRNA 2-selenouridine(34) synthase MnmH [Oscillatoriales cyanobacterium SM2_3_0]
MPQSFPPDKFLNISSPLLDVRSPAEYTAGHISGALSFPLFTDEERAQVGTCYKQQGRNQAVELGFAIAGPKFAQFIAQASRLTPDRQVGLYCWRGGMRSSAVAWVLEMAGFQVSLLIGGYKAFRRWGQGLFRTSQNILMLGGMTGTGKTEILRALRELEEQVLDLEALANHRGSSYGALGQPSQPSNEQFRNLIIAQWAGFNPAQPLWIEAESKRIGHCRIPDEIFQQMEQAPVIEVKRARSERLELLVQDYGQFAVEDLVVATERIRKRLGGLKTQQAIDFLKQEKFSQAFDLILDYYDKTYTYDLKRRSVPFHEFDGGGQSAFEIAKQLHYSVQKISQSNNNVWGGSSLESEGDDVNWELINGAQTLVGNL